ncbi:MAG TPA: type II secretion system protein N [Rhodocyclaceae bacterium]|nr:type II secretion system protein N [Rhodocyclaceae bacterium]
MKILVVLAAIVVMAIAMAPASLVDRELREVTHGDVRLGRTEGTIWHGQGTIDVKDSGTQEWKAWHELRWSLDLADLLRGWLAWRVMIEGAEPAQLAIGPAHWRATNLTLAGPARYLVQHLANPLAKLGWQGDLSVATPNLECSWQGICDGTVRARWLNAGCDCLPGQVFGDYSVDATVAMGDVRFNLMTLAGQIHVDGTGGFSNEKPLTLDATISGDPVIMSRLPAVASPWATPTTDPAVWKIHL